MVRSAIPSGGRIRGSAPASAGNAYAPPTIPPNAPLVFVIDLLAA